jgi:hypothetical protein
MYYTWSSELSKLVRSGATNLSGLIGAQDPAKSNYELLAGASVPDEGLEVYKKKDRDVFLVMRQSLGLKIYCKIDSLHGLMYYLRFSRILTQTSQYIDDLANDDEDYEED